MAIEAGLAILAVCVIAAVFWGVLREMDKFGDDDEDPDGIAY
jgi:hypothetical protein